MYDLLVQFWQFTIVGILILISYIVALVRAESHDDDHLEFKSKGMPHMKPIPIPTKDKGFWGGIWTWLMVTRRWEITKDFHYSINNQDLVIPKGFIFDGASVPKFLRSWLSPMGVLLIGGLVHDYGYKYETFLRKGKKTCYGLLRQKKMDIIFSILCLTIRRFFCLAWP